MENNIIDNIESAEFVEENNDLKNKQEAINQMFQNEEFAKMWKKMHTPFMRSERKVGRNEICPFCNSGKKFKNCECYKIMNQKTSY